MDIHRSTTVRTTKAIGSASADVVNSDKPAAVHRDDVWGYVVQCFAPMRVPFSVFSQTRISSLPNYFCENGSAYRATVMNDLSKTALERTPA